MARRRRWGTGARLAHGLGTGLSEAMNLLIRQQMMDRNAKAIADREEAHDERVFRRQGKLAEDAAARETRSNLIGMIPDVAADKLTPEALMAMARAQGVDLPSEAVESARPPLRRRLESTLGADIDKAKTDSDVPDLQTLIGRAKALDPRASQGGLDTSMLIDPTEPSQALFTMAPEVGEYATRAQDRAQTLRQPMTEAIAALPNHLKPYADLFKHGVVKNLGPDDLQSPAEREASEIRVRKASIAPPNQNNQFEKIETVDEAGNPIIKYLTPQEVRQMGGVRGQPKTTAKASGPATVQAILAEIDALSQGINQGAADPSTTVTGLMRRGASAVNLDNELAEYEALIQGFTPMIARAVGHTGVLTQQDVESVRALFPKPTDNQALAQAKLARVRRLMEQIAQSQMTPGVSHETTTEQAPPASSPFYQQYLNRRRGGQ